jgi:hypothetical protein
MGKKGNTRFWWGNLEERHQLEDLGVDGISYAIYAFIFKEQDSRT